jgi:hypothetical protein
MMIDIISDSIERDKCDDALSHEFIYKYLPHVYCVSFILGKLKVVTLHVTA